MNTYTKEAGHLKSVLEELMDTAQFAPGELIVFGCSSSEIGGSKIGTASSLEIAQVLFPVLLRWADENALHIAVQGCEHINRSLAVTAECAAAYGLEPVCVVPHLGAGGAFCTLAFETLPHAVMVESLLGKAHGGVDIGNTFIGMHMRRVVVPVRTTIRQIGGAAVNCAKTRPMLVGGERARYC